MKTTQIIIVTLTGLLSMASLATEKQPLPRGEIRMSLRNGGSSQEFRYRYNATQLRIDRPGEIIPSPPVNLLDLKKGVLTLLHPHNGTCEQAALNGEQTDRPTRPIPPATMPTMPEQSHRAPPADWPEMPKMQGMPQNLPKGIGLGAEKAPSSINAPMGMPSSGMPAFPEMPAFPMMGMGGNEPMALVPQNQTNELFGYSCQLFDVKVPEFGTLQLWLCDDPSLPPFHQLRHELLHRHGRPEWEEQVAQLLRKEKKFPFRAELKGEGDDLIAEWRVLSIKTDVKESDQTGIFDLPSNVYLLPAEEW